MRPVLSSIFLLFLSSRSVTSFFIVLCDFQLCEGNDDVVEERAMIFVFCGVLN